jgi:hypothetical protein
VIINEFGNELTSEAETITGDDHADGIETVGKAITDDEGTLEIALFGTDDGTLLYEIYATLEITTNSVDGTPDRYEIETATGLQIDPGRAIIVLTISMPGENGATHPLFYRPVFETIA